MLAEIASFVLRHVIFVQMLSIGCLLPPHAFADTRRRPGLYARSLVALLVALPLVVLLITTALRPRPFATALFLLMAVCPGAPMIPRATKAKGEAYSEVGLNLLVLLSIALPVTIPLWLWILGKVSPIRGELAITPWAVFRHVFATVLSPLVLGLLVRRLLPRLAPAVGRAARWVFFVGFAVGIVLAVKLGASVFLRIHPTTVVVAFVIVTASALMGWIAARPHSDACRPAAMTAALGNPGLVLAIVASSHPQFHGAAFVVAYVLLRKVALVPFDMWSKRSTDSGGCAAAR